MPRKLIAFHPETLSVLEQLAEDRAGTLQELADEAFDDVLRKHGRAVGLKAALRKSVARRAAPRGAGAARRPFGNEALPRKVKNRRKNP